MRTQLHHLLEEGAVRFGDRPALSHQDVTLDYTSAWDLASRTGAVLSGLGVARGDRVAVYLDKRPETIGGIFGASVAGGVFVPVNPALKGSQVAYILGDCDVRVLITTHQRWESVREDAKGCRELAHVLLVDAEPGAVSDEDEVRVHALSALLDDVVEPPPASRAIDVDTAAILYTSGSTGRPKGVVLSHRNLLVGAESVSSYLGNDGDDVILAALPLSFDAGLSQVTTAFAAGAHVVLVNYLLARDVVRLCARHGVTGLTCVPPLWIQLAAADWPAEATASLRYFANTGGRMPRSTLTRLREIFPQASPFLMYGLTEAFRSTYLDPSEVDRRPDSIGKAIPDAEILVLQPDGTPCGPGEEGELVHRGAARRPGLLGRRRAHRRAVPPHPGWPRLARARAGRVVRRPRRRRRGGLPLLRRPHRRHDQDLRLPGEPDRDRGGRLRQRPGPRRGRARPPGRAPSGTGSWSSSAPRSRGSSPTRCSRSSAVSCPATWCRRRSSCAPSSPARPTGSSTGCCCARS